MLIIIVITVAMVLPAVAFLYLFIKSIRLPRNRPSEYLKRKQADDSRAAIVLAGDSLTHGKVGVDYIQMLANQLDAERYTLVNAGVNSHLAWNLLQRLDEIIECNPKIVTILIGTNDATAATSDEEGRAHMRKMKLPQLPDHAWFRETLRTIVTRLQSETSARIALLSIPTIGERPDDPAFLLSQNYGTTVKEIATETHVTYLPLQEQMTAYLRENPGAPKYPFEKTNMQMYKAIAKRHLLRKSWDRIAEDTGFRLHTDYLHLNSIGAGMVADMIMQFIKSTQSL